MKVSCNYIIIFRLFCEIFSFYMKLSSHFMITVKLLTQRPWVIANRPVDPVCSFPCSPSKENIFWHAVHSSLKSHWRASNEESVEKTHHCCKIKKILWHRRLWCLPFGFFSAVVFLTSHSGPRFLELLILHWKYYCFVSFRVQRTELAWWQLQQH